MLHFIKIVMNFHIIYHVSGTVLMNQENKKSLKISTRVQREIVNLTEITYSIRAYDIKPGEKKDEW